MKFAIEPHRGIGPVSFGMSRSEVEDVMDRIGGGRAHARGKETDCYFENVFQISFSSGSSADFIEVANNVTLTFTFHGHDIFDIPADVLLDLIQDFDEADPALSRPPYDYIFPNLILTLWDRDEQYDHKGGEQRPMFGAIGIGTLQYLNAIRAIPAN